MLEAMAARRRREPMGLMLWLARRMRSERGVWTRFARVVGGVMDLSVVDVGGSGGGDGSSEVVLVSGWWVGVVVVKTRSVLSWRVQRKLWRGLMVRSSGMTAGIYITVRMKCN